MEKQREDTKILIVDDIAYIRMLVKRLLQKNRFKYIREAGDGVQAIEVFKEFKPDIILLDLMLPKISGLDLIRIFLDINYKIKILIVSAIEEKGTQIEAIEKGALDYLIKPIEESTFMDKVNELVDSKSVITPNKIENLTTESHDYSKKLGIKLDFERSLQIINIYGVFNDPEFTDLKKTIMSLQLYHYNNVILNLNGITQYNIDMDNLVKLQDIIDKKKGQFVIVSLQDEIKNKFITSASLKECVVKTEKQALDKL